MSRLLRCRCGTQLATLTTARTATVRDFVPLVNIGSFGRCSAPDNPARLDGDATAPCVPSIDRPWLPGHARLRSGGVPLLARDDTTRCRWGGVIVQLATEPRRG